MMAHYDGFVEAELRSALAAAGQREVDLRKEIERLRAIVTAAWAVRREQRDYNPCPDLLLRATAREYLHKLLDEWQAAEAAKEKSDG